VVATFDRRSIASLPRVIDRCDVVDVCLPTPLHADASVAALAAGRHVLVEKPLALSLADADRIITAAEQSAGALMVAHVVRFFPAYRRLRAVISAGALGRPLGAQAYRFTGGDPAIEWLTDPTRSGGALVDLLVHDYDVLNSVLGPAQSVAAREDAAGTATAQLDHGDGVISSVVGSMTLPPAYPFRAGVRVVLDGGVAEVLPSGAVQLVDGTGVHEEPAVMSVDPYVEQARHLLDCLDAGTRPVEGTAAQARAALAVAVAARSSAAAGGRPRPVPA
jgi:predicted dehydrogenase